jgi:NAD(P)-dependent dehydrogenase (short-subunit alcohol dehydrogenase family)
MALGGRCAIITGANQGLGQAIAGRFVQSGASVLLAARGAERLRQVERELRELARPGQIVVSHTGDVSRPEDCQAIVSHALQVLPDLTILVNNAGIYGPMGRVEDNDWDEWMQAFQINLFGTVLMCRAVLPHLRAKRYGKIVNLSGGGATVPLPRLSSYAAAKAAVVRFT